MRSAIMEISILIAFFIVGWVAGEWISFFYIALGLIAFYNLIMIFYFVGKGREMSGMDKFLGVAAMIIWLGIAGVMILAKQNDLWGFMQ